MGQGSNRRRPDFPGSKAWICFPLPARERDRDGLARTAPTCNGPISSRTLGFDVPTGARVRPAHLQVRRLQLERQLQRQRHEPGYTRRDGGGLELLPARARTIRAPASRSTVLTGVRCYVFIGDGKIAYGKPQALDYGAITLQIAGDFDACLARIRHIAENMPQAGVYLANFRSIPSGSGSEDHHVPRARRS